jgi:CelD/BcsL family acetyltransferase involved in cellulose biosynthesis
VTVAQLAVRDEPFDAIAAEWSDLLAQAPSPMPFSTPEWQRVWLRHFQGERALRVLTARDGERLIGVAPLLIDESEHAAQFVGHHSICDYMDAVVAPGYEQEFFARVLERLAQDGITSLDLRGVRQWSPTLDALCTCAGGCGYGVERQEEALSPSVELPGDWESYLGQLSKKDRHELRRKLRRLMSAGGVELQVVTAPDEAAEKLDTLFRLMRISSHHKEEFLDRPGMEAFFRDMTRTMAEAGMIRFYFLTFDGKPVASVLNFDVGGVLYMYNSGYDPEYAHYAVGLMSKALLLQDAIEHGRSCVDFLRGDESYKYDLGGKDQQVYRLVLTK